MKWQEEWASRATRPSTTSTRRIYSLSSCLHNDDEVRKKEGLGESWQEEKEGMTAIVRRDSHGLKYALFLVTKAAHSKIVVGDAENKSVWHCFG